MYFDYVLIKYQDHYVINMYIEIVYCDFFPEMLTETMTTCSGFLYKWSLYVDGLMGDCI